MSQTKTNWKIGKSTLDKTMDDLHKAYAVAHLIKYAEDKHANLMAYANGEITNFFPELRVKSLRQAEITLMAHRRLVKYFNNLINEIHISQ